jgi:hypothetical protein
MSTKYHQQQQLIHHNASLIQNNYTLNVTLKIKAEEVRCIRKIENENIADSFIERKTIIADEIDFHFLICQSCFWCASYYISPKMFSRTTKATKNISEIDITKCPSCIEGDPIFGGQKT